MRVLVTRPEPGASRTAERLRALGHQPVVLPLSETVGVEDETPFDGQEIDAIAATSAQAFRHAPPEFVRALRQKVVFTVGAATAAAARQAGFDDVEAADGDAASMAVVMAMRLKPGATVAYLAGRVRTDGLETALAGADFVVSTFETYDTRARTPDAGEISVACEEGVVDIALVYSRNGARRLREVAAREDIAALLTGTRFLCLSEQVAEGLEGVDAARVLIAARPDEQALFALFETGAGTQGG